MSEQDYAVGDRVMRRSGMYESEGVVRRVTPTHVDVHWFDSCRTSTIRKDRIKPVPKEEPKTYPDLASAQEAMDRGETVRIEMQPWEINPALLQLAQDLQDKERLEEWKAQPKGESK